MSIIVKNLLRSSLILGVAAISFSACKKEEMRSRRYDMMTHDNSGVTGYVEFTEKEGGKTNIHVHMMGVVNGQNYPVHIHNGPITSPGTVAIDLGPIMAGSGMAMKDTESSMSYDELIAFNGCFVAHNPQAADPLTTYVLVGNVGSNAPQ